MKNNITSRTETVSITIFCMKSISISFLNSLLNKGTKSEKYESKLKNKII